MYTTPQYIASRLGTALTTDQTEYFTDVLSNGIAAYIDSITGTTFDSDVVTDVFVTGEGGSYITIPTMHDITAVKSLTDVGAVDTTYTVTEYALYPRSSDNKIAIRNIGGTWAEGTDNFVITGKLGYADVPADIVMVATELAISVLNSNTSNYRSESTGDWSVTYADTEKNVSPQAKEILRSYQRISRSI